MYPVSFIIDPSGRADASTIATLFEVEEGEELPLVKVSKGVELGEPEWKVSAAQAIPPDDADSDAEDGLFIDVVPLDPEHATGFQIPEGYVLVAQHDDEGNLIQITITPVDAAEAEAELADAAHANATVAAEGGRLSSFRRAMFEQGGRGSWLTRAMNVLAQHSPRHRSLSLSGRRSHAASAVRGAGLRVHGSYVSTPLEATQVRLGLRGARALAPSNAVRAGNVAGGQNHQEELAMADQDLRRLLGNNPVEGARTLLAKTPEFTSLDELGQARVIGSILRAAGLVSPVLEATKDVEQLRMAVSKATRTLQATATTAKAPPGTSVIDSSLFPGANDTQRAVAAYRGTVPGADKLPYDEVFELACQAKNAGRIVNLASRR